MPGRAEADAAAHAGPTGHALPAAPTPRVGAPGPAGARALPAAAVPAQGGARCTSSRLCPGRTPPPGAPRGRDGHHGLRRASARPACGPTAPTGRLLPFAGCQVMPPPARDRKGHCHAAPVLPTPALGCSGHTARAGVRLRPRCRHPPHAARSPSTHPGQRQECGGRTGFPPTRDPGPGWTDTAPSSLPPCTSQRLPARWGPSGRLQTRVQERRSEHGPTRTHTHTALDRHGPHQPHAGPARPATLPSAPAPCGLC